MFDFHYNYICEKYGDKADLLFTDTDSLMYEIETEHFYKYISNDVRKKFDTSDYPENHPSEIKTGINKKVIETLESLRAKLYSYKLDDLNKVKEGKM